MFKVFAIFNAFTLTRYILPIVVMVNVSAVFAEPIYTPSTQKEELFIPRQVIGKLSNSGLECGEFGLQNINDFNVSFRPLSREWVETSEFGKNSGFELLTSSYTPRLALTPISETMVAKDSNKNSKESYQCDGYCALYISLPFWLLSLCTTLGLNAQRVAKGLRAFAQSRLSVGLGALLQRGLEMTVETEQTRATAQMAEALRHGGIAVGTARKPQFGEWLRGIWASENNPHRDGRYVKTVRRTGIVNRGTFYELTDGKGDFWQYMASETVFIEAPNV